MQPSLGKDPEDKELNAVLLPPSFPRWGALALSDSLRFPPLSPEIVSNQLLESILSSAPIAPHHSHRCCGIKGHTGQCWERNKPCGWPCRLPKLRRRLHGLHTLRCHEEETWILDDCKEERPAEREAHAGIHLTQGFSAVGPESSISGSGFVYPSILSGPGPAVLEWKPKKSVVPGSLPARPMTEGSPDSRANIFRETLLTLT
eukprot:bmy_00490T0